MFYVTELLSHQLLICFITAAKQLRKINCSILFVFESRKFDVLSMHFEKGSCSEKTFQECLRTAMKASETIFKFYREAVERKFSKELD